MKRCAAPNPGNTAVPPPRGVSARPRDSFTSSGSTARLSLRRRRTSRSTDPAGGQTDTTQSHREPIGPQGASKPPLPQPHHQQIGILNPSTDCYMIALLQIIHHLSRPTRGNRGTSTLGSEVGNAPIASPLPVGLQQRASRTTPPLSSKKRKRDRALAHEIAAFVQSMREAHTALRSVSSQHISAARKEDGPEEEVLHTPEDGNGGVGEALALAGGTDSAHHHAVLVSSRARDVARGGGVHLGTSATGGNPSLSCGSLMTALRQRFPQFVPNQQHDAAEALACVRSVFETSSTVAVEGHEGGLLRGDGVEEVARDVDAVCRRCTHGSTVVHITCSRCEKARLR